jgi:hypothetical protein
MGLPVNAKLTWSLPTPPAANAMPVFDGDGNPIAPAKDFVVSATMRLDEKAKYMGGAGLQPGQVRMVGRSIKPKFLPELPRVCRMIVTDPVTKFMIQGTLTIDLPAQSKFKGVTKALGTKIGGIFVEDTGRS